jgi:hypothetical protein
MYTDKIPFDDWMHCHDFGRSTVLLGMDCRIKAGYNIFNDMKTFFLESSIIIKVKVEAEPLQDNGRPFYYQGKGLYRYQQLHITD